MTDREWCEKKAHDMIAHETLIQKESPHPCGRFGEGLIQAFYALGLLSDSKLSGYTLILQNTVQEQQIACLEAKVAARNERLPSNVECFA